MSRSFETSAPAATGAGTPGSAPARRPLRILVADDDGLSRAVLRSMIRQHQASALVVEADNGGQALEIVHATGVDALFLDLRMPVMDGLEVLATLRADAAHRGLPVVVLSAHSDPATVRHAIRLGITDYLVKPLRPLAMESRIQHLLAVADKRHAEAHPHRAVRPTRAATGGPRLLLVDADPSFCAFFVGLFEEALEIVAVDNGRDAARVLADWTPDVACLGAGLKLPTELELARKIRKQCPSAALWLLGAQATLAGEAVPLFDGALAKSFVPTTFRAELARALPGGGAVIPAPAAGLLDDALREAVVTATRQTLGVTTMQELTLLGREAAAPLAGEVWATVELRGAPEQPAVAVALAAPRAHVEHIAERMLGAPTPLADGAADAFGELINTVAGRVLSGLESRGVPLKIGLPSVTAAPAPDHAIDRWTILLPFETAGGERFLVGVGLLDGARGPAAAA